MKEFETYLKEAEEERRAVDAEWAERKTRRGAKRLERSQNVGRALFLLLLGGILAIAVLTVRTAADEPVPVSEKPEAEDFENQRIESALKSRAIRVGECRVTFYTCSALECGNDDGITSSGVRAVPEVTVAVDPAVIPLGCDVLVKWKDGTEQWCRSDDTGSAIVGKQIDLCVAERTDALNRGVTTAEVSYVPEDG